MNLNKLIAPLLIGGAIFFLPHKGTQLNAQDTSSIEVSINKSSLFRDTNETFFDGYSFSVLYSSELIEYLDYYTELGALSAMDDNQNYLDGIFRFSTSIIHLDIGIHMHLVNNAKHAFLLGIGSSLRNRKMVHHLAQIETQEGVYFTYDEFINSYDYGGAFQLKYLYMLRNSYSVGIKTGLKIYNEGNSILDTGVTIAKHF